MTSINPSPLISTNLEPKSEPSDFTKYVGLFHWELTSFHPLPVLRYAFFTGPLSFACNMSALPSPSKSTNCTPSSTPLDDAKSIEGAQVAESSLQPVALLSHAFLVPPQP